LTKKKLAPLGWGEGLVFAAGLVEVEQDLVVTYQIPESGRNQGGEEGREDFRE
jgi:hypothetical protein